MTYKLIYIHNIVPTVHNFLYLNNIKLYVIVKLLLKYKHLLKFLV